MSIRQRRILAVSVTLGAAILTASLVRYVHNSLGDEATITGWTLLTSTLLLYALTYRKRNIAKNLGRVSIWLQFHMYTGVFASLVFLMHIGWPIHGGFEIALASGFTLVAVSGVVLGLMSRIVPKKLAAIGADFRYEDIPVQQHMVAQQAHELAVAASEFGEGATLADFYKRRLLSFFNSSRGIWYSIVPNGFLRRKLMRELSDLDRYLAAKGIGNRRALSNLVKDKDDLDYHLAMQRRLRFLYLFHFSLTWLLLLMIAVHVVLVYRFQGAM